MLRTYRFLAVTIAGLVVVQAASLAWFGAGDWAFIDRGGVVDKALIESSQTTGELPFPEVAGVIVHGITGGMLIPAVSVILFLVSFWAQFPRSVAIAGGLLALIVAQLTMGYAMTGMPFLGLLHGANAMIILLLAAYAAVRARRGSALVVAAPAGRVHAGA